ncbi:MAG: WYL domain-containing protein, partial [Coriobacteriia bacterium]
GSLRTFRVDRMREARVLDETIPERQLSPAGTAFASSGLPVARVRFHHGETVSDREWPGLRVVSTDPDGVITVEVPYSGTAWIARQVAARLGRAEVLEPTEVREAVLALVTA